MEVDEKKEPLKPAVMEALAVNLDYRISRLVELHDSRQRMMEEVARLDNEIIEARSGAFDVAVFMDMSESPTSSVNRAKIADALTAYN
jgi:hypothetical protein